MGIQRMNKKGIFKQALFSVVVISLMVIAYATIIDEQAQVYQSNAESELSQFNKLNEISSTAEGYETSLTPDDPEPGQDAEASTFRGVYGIVTGMFGALNVVVGDGGMIDSVTTQFGIPDVYRQGAITIIFIALAFGLVAVIFRLGNSP